MRCRPGFEDVVTYRYIPFHPVTYCRPGFEVVVSTHFAVADAVEFLSVGSLPMDMLQPIMPIVTPAPPRVWDEPAEGEEEQLLESDPDQPYRLVAEYDGHGDGLHVRLRLAADHEENTTLNH